MARARSCGNFCHGLQSTRLWGAFTVQAICSTERSAELAQSLCGGQYGVPQHTTNFLELFVAVGGCRGVHCSAEPAACALCPRGAGSRQTCYCGKAAGTTAAHRTGKELVSCLWSGDARHKKVFLFVKPSPPSTLKTTQRSRAAAGRKTRRIGTGREAGTVQFQPVFQPVRCLLWRGDVQACL